MGIPSFYRALFRQFKTLIRPGTGPRSEWLCLDFNCAMYHVLSKQPPFGASASAASAGAASACSKAAASADACATTAADAWEANFRKEICDYLTEIVTLANPLLGVHVACDGVVCAAKRRQQRLRRFKRPFEVETEHRLRGSSGSGWDSTALTPGSAFMEQLSEDLRKAGASLAARTGLEVVVSPPTEPGEGEHKLMALMRSRKPASCTIYGLDADLILLAMLLQAEGSGSVFLLREAQEFESAAAAGAAGAEPFRVLDVAALSATITATIPASSSPAEAARVRDFVATMSLLGNDFLPRSLTKTVRNEGVFSLLDILRNQVWAKGDTVVCPETDRIKHSGLLPIVAEWARTEESDLLQAVKGALRDRMRPPFFLPSQDPHDPREKAVAEWKSQPAQTCSIARLAAVSATAAGTKSLTLHPAWKEIVQAWTIGTASVHAPVTADGYLAGLAWVWDYYRGVPVCQGWVYDKHLPPLWCDVATTLAASASAGGGGATATIEPPPIVYVDGLPPWVHLLSVLPASSVRSLLPREKQTLLDTCPWYWPARWALFDVGRTQIWECEPVIPLIPEALLRKM